jgi:hypothetical protein
MTRARRAGRVALGAVGLAALVFVPGLPPLCPMRWVVHLPCPGCGLTRAAGLALTGHFVAATRMHPLWFIVLPLVGFVIVADSLAYVRGAWTRSVLEHARTSPVAIGVVALMIAVWIARFFGMFGGPAPV